MNDLNHTPGPWEYRPNEHDDWGMVRGGQTPWGLGPICQARDPRYLDDAFLAECRSNGRDPWEANARLIAAAPELLEAVVKLRKYVKRIPYEVLTASDAAIAKATGAAL